MLTTRRGYTISVWLTAIAAVFALSAFEPAHSAERKVDPLGHIQHGFLRL